MTRVLTAVALVALLVLCLWLPPVAFATFVAVAVLLGWHEFARLASEAGARPMRGLGPLAALACSLGFVATGWIEDAPLLALLLTVLASTGAALVAGRRHPALAVRRAVATVAGCVWIGTLPGCHLAIRLRPDGLAWLALLYVCVPSGDIAALYGGRTVGRTPLAPSLSPNKTVEGSLAGGAASCLAGGVLSLFALPEVSTWEGLAVGLGLGVAGQLGDLFESSLKRSAGVKDSSGLLPGHGGLLDRVDGLLLAGAALYLYLGLR